MEGRGLQYFNFSPNDFDDSVGLGTNGVKINASCFFLATGAHVFMPLYV
jgi:hypothetical protein